VPIATNSAKDRCGMSTSNACMGRLLRRIFIGLAG